MSRKRKVVRAFGTGAMALALLGAFSAQTLRQESAYQTLDTPSAYSLTCEKTISPYTRQKPILEPHVRLVSAYTHKDRVIAPPMPQPALVDVETANVKSNGTQPTEIDFEPPKPSDRPAILTSKEPPRCNPTPQACIGSDTKPASTCRAQNGRHTHRGRAKASILFRFRLD